MSPVQILGLIMIGISLVMIIHGVFFLPSGTREFHRAYRRNARKVRKM